MNTASLELCKELYELSGWGNDPSNADSTEKVWHRTLNVPPSDWVCWGRTHLSDGNTPAYDLGYLLRKLPLSTQVTLKTAGCLGGLDVVSVRADNPEDAAAKLAIELFKQEILTKA